MSRSKCSLSGLAGCNLRLVWSAMKSRPLPSFNQNRHCNRPPSDAIMLANEKSKQSNQCNVFNTISFPATFPTQVRERPERKQTQNEGNNSAEWRGGVLHALLVHVRAWHSQGKQCNQSSAEPPKLLSNAATRTTSQRGRDSSVSGFGLSSTTGCPSGSGNNQATGWDTCCCNPSSQGLSCNP